jgi:alanine racemase
MAPIAIAEIPLAQYAEGRLSLVQPRHHPGHPAVNPAANLAATPTTNLTPDSRVSPDLSQQRAWVEIDGAALAHNVAQLRSILEPTTTLLTVVKADAYGHGATTVARIALAHGATWLGVATISEGIQLRRSGLTAPILLLGATNTADEVRAIVTWQLQPTICTPKQALVFSETLADMNNLAAADAPPLSVHLKLDTGMSRLGSDWEQAVALVQWVISQPQLQIASLYSHLATADSNDPTFMAVQQQRFETAIAQLRALNLCPNRLHLANSAATLADPALHYDMVRCGLATYGLYPAGHLADRLALWPVMQVRARVTQVKTIAAGTGVSYGLRYVAQSDRRVAVVGIGYADGVPRNLSTRMEVLVRGRRLRQLGSITMDQLMIDVTELPDVEAGEIVTILGRSGQDQITADDWAEMLGTISWEILCGFKNRLPRILV